MDGRVVFFSHPQALKEIFTADPEVFDIGKGNEYIGTAPFYWSGTVIVGSIPLKYKYTPTGTEAWGYKNSRLPGQLHIKSALLATRGECSQDFSRSCVLLTLGCTQ